MKKMFSTILLTLFLCMFCTKTLAYDIAVENADGVMIYYNYIKKGQELEVTRNSYNSYSGTVVIPEEVTYMNNTRKVTGIANEAFYQSVGLTSVTIPNSVTSLGYNAFCECISLTSITIPNSVKSIGEGALAYCSSLTSVIIPDSITSIEEGTFYSCSGLTSITIPSSVTSIGKEAFKYCSSLTTITIPNSVTSIEEGAFQWCRSLPSITIPNSLTSIEDGMFMHFDSLASIIIPNSVTSIGYAAFFDCKSLASVTIGNSVKSIGELAFQYCVSLTSIIIPNSVTSIERSAFEGCSSLTSVTMGNSVANIGDLAFYKCSGLTSITIPSSVTSIGRSAFGEIDFNSVVSRIENPFEILGTSSVFGKTFSLNTFNNSTLYVPVGTKGKYKATEGWKDFVFIEEGTDGTSQMCEKPTISYSKGKLTFHSATEGAICQSTITDADIASYSSNEVQLGVTYYISVYATKDGYEDSETATATLCWIDVEPKTEGIENGVASIRANAVLIQSNDGILDIQGIDEGTPISVFNTSGQLVGAAKASAGNTNISTTLKKGEVGIVKIGEKTVKVVIK